MLLVWILLFGNRPFPPWSRRPSCRKARTIPAHVFIGGRETSTALQANFHSTQVSRTMQYRSRSSKGSKVLSTPILRSAQSFARRMSPGDEISWEIKHAPPPDFCLSRTPAALIVANYLTLRRRTRTNLVRALANRTPCFSLVELVLQALAVFNCQQLHC